MLHSLDQRIAVAIPVKNEQDHIGGCIEALLGQSTPVDDIVLLFNNCTDQSLAVCLDAADGFPGLHVLRRDLLGAEASAGEARRLALEYAAEIIGDGLILTTDADGAATPYWVKENVAAFAAGADAVCGRAEVTAEDAAKIPLRLHHDHMREVGCLTLLDEIDAILNPDEADPWPRHSEHSGASIAMTAAAFRRAGGAPKVARAEDRIMIERLMLTDARIRHAPDVVVTVSGRLEGRATGGMADTIKRRLVAPDILTDDTLEPATDAYRRALAKARLRPLWRDNLSGEAMARDLLVSGPAMAAALAAPFFGVAWAEVQRLSPVLQRRRLAVADLERETVLAARLRDDLLNRALNEPIAGRAIAG